MLRATPAILAVLLLLAGPVPAQDKQDAFDAGFRAAVTGYFSRRPANPEAAAAAAFVASAGGLRFESSELSGVKTGLAEAQYVPSRRAVVVSAESLKSSGIEPSHWNIPPSVLESAVSRMAPLLIHELRHARAHHDLGFSPPVLENELCAYAAEARFVAAEPELATGENWRAGAAFLDEQVPLVLERMELISRLKRLYAGSKEALDSGNPEESVRLSKEFLAGDARRVEVESLMREKQGDLAARYRLPLMRVESFMLWAAYSKGWDELKRAVSHVRLPSVEASDADVSLFLEEEGKARSAVGRPAPLAGDFWGDPARRKAARDYFVPEAARLASESGGGFREAPPAAEPPAPRKGTRRLRLLTAVGGAALCGLGLLAFFRR